MFTGTHTAIVTPFKNGKIDEAALERLVKSQIIHDLEQFEVSLQTERRILLNRKKRWQEDPVPHCHPTPI